MTREEAKRRRKRVRHSGPALRRVLKGSPRRKWESLLAGATIILLDALGSLFCPCAAADVVELMSPGATQWPEDDLQFLERAIDEIMEEERL